MASPTIYSSKHRCKRTETGLGGMGYCRSLLHWLILSAYIGICIGTLGICHDAYRHSIKSDIDFLKSAGIISTQLRIGMNGS